MLSSSRREVRLVEAQSVSRDRCARAVSWSAGAWRPGCGKPGNCKASARASLTANGTVEIASATADIGPGTYTMMAQLAAGMLGMPLENVTAKLGDSTLAERAGGRRIIHRLLGRRCHSRRLPGGAKGAAGVRPKTRGSPLAEREARRCRVRRRPDPAQGDAGRVVRSPTRCAPATPSGSRRKPPRPEDGQRIRALSALGGIRRGQDR